MLLEKTQRRLFRLLFVLGCVLPTLAVAGYSAHRLRPGYARGVLDAVGRSLGAQVTCDHLSTPRPGVYELRNARLRDRGGDPIASGDRLRLEQAVGGWRFTADTIRVDDGAATGGWLGKLLGSTVVTRGTIRTLHLDEQTTLASVSLRAWEDDRGDRSLSIDSASGARFAAVMSADGSRVEADTAGVAIPATWLPACPLPAISGGSIRFAGKLNAELSHNGSPATGAAVGRMTLASIGTERLRAATGSVGLEQLSWRDGRVASFRGRLDLRDGEVARPLVFGACRWLEMEPLGPMEQRYADPANRAWFAFDQLACDVELDSAGLVVVAGCGEIDGRQRGGAVAHAVLEQGGEPLLREPLRRPLPAQRLVQAWHPDEPAELPATAAAIEMANRLPEAIALPR